MVPHRRKISTKMILAFLAPTVVIVLLFDLFVYYRADITLENDLGLQLRNVAGSVAGALSQRQIPVAQITRLTARGRVYSRERAFLESIRAATGVRRIAVLGPPSEHYHDPLGVANLRVKVDTSDSPIDARDRSLELDSYEIRRTIEQRRAESSMLRYSVGEQTYKTGYAPVVVDDRVALVVAVEGSPQYYANLRSLRNALALYSVVAITLILLTAVVVANRIVKPLAALTEAASRIGAGDTQTEVRSTSNDEIGFLGETLEQMRQNLARRERELQMMLSGVAHEVRNPLGGMELFCGLLREEIDVGSDAASCLDRIERELQYLDSIVNQFLAFARVVNLDRQPVVLRPLLEEVKDLVASELDKALISVAFDGDSRAAIAGDADRLRQVFLNLMHNSIHAQKDTGGAIAVSWDRTGDEIRILFSDDGPGISPEIRADVFSAFFTTKAKGTGLGLAIVKKLIEAHGGTIELHGDREGALPTRCQGAVFVIHLPAA